MKKKPIIAILLIAFFLVLGTLFFMPSEVHAPETPAQAIDTPPPTSTETPPTQASLQPQPSKEPEPTDTPTTYIAGKVVNAADNTPVTDFWVTTMPQSVYDFRTHWNPPKRGGLKSSSMSGVPLYKGKPYEPRGLHVQDPDGAFRLVEFETDTPLVLEFSADGLSQKHNLPPVKEGTAVAGLVIMLYSATVTGIVTNVQGAPVPDAQVSLNEHPRTTTDKNGSFTIERLPLDNQWIVFVKHPDYARKKCV